MKGQASYSNAIDLALGLSKWDPYGASRISGVDLRAPALVP
jgi:hypothetical protein